MNHIIQSLATQIDAIYLATGPSFLGNEAQHTYQAQQPAKSSVGGEFGGLLPVGNVQPNALGCSVIAADSAATPMPEPTGLAIAFSRLLRSPVQRRSGLRPEPHQRTVVLWTPGNGEVEGVIIPIQMQGRALQDASSASF